MFLSFLNSSLIFMVPLLTLALAAQPQAASRQEPGLPPGRAFSAPGSDPGARVWLTDGPEPELWITIPKQAPRPVLRGSSEHISAPYWSPDGHKVAVLVGPTGTQTLSLSRWFVADIATDGSASFVAAPPAWVADIGLGASPIPGRRGDGYPDVGAQGQSLPAPTPQITLDADMASESISAPSSATALKPPDTIRVKHSINNPCRDLPVGQVTIEPFEDYVQRVVPRESPAGWPAAALQAQAIAARTYAWYQMLARQSLDYDVKDWTEDQAMCDEHDLRTDAAVNATAGYYLSYNGQMVFAQYSAENSSPTLDGSKSYLKSIMDPVGVGKVRYGHGHGLSQWGAYRWAFNHNWSATQILMHYYTGVQVIDPSGCEPLLTLLAPWPGIWVTGAGVSIAAHGNTELLSSVTFQAPGWQDTDSNGADGWIAPWIPSSALTGPFTVSTAGGGRTATSALAGMDRQPPTGQINLPESSAMQTVTLNFSAIDDGDSGIARMAAGGDWQIKAVDLWKQSGSGSLITDRSTLSGNGLWFPAGSSGTWQTSFTDLVTTGQVYQAYVRARVDGNPVEPLAPVARVELFDPNAAAGQQVVGFIELHHYDFREPGVYQEFPVDVWISPDNGIALMARVTGTGNSEVTVDRIRLLEKPLTYQSQMQFRLPAQSGWQTVVAKVLDGAANPSADLTAITTWTGAASADEWQLVDPTGWVTTTGQPLIVAYATGSFATYAMHSSFVRTSTNGGTTWTQWQPITPTTTYNGAVRIEWQWTGATGAGANRLQFGAEGAQGEWTSGPRWPIRIDLTPPTLHAELSATPNAAGWITTPVTLTLAAEDTVSGIAEITWENTGVWKPYEALPMFAGEGDMRVGYQARNQAGLGSAPEEISWRMDTVPPIITTLDTPGWVSPGQPFAPNWLGSDGGGIAAYDVQTSPDNATWQDWLIRTSQTSASYPAMPAMMLYLRVRAVDLAGNVGEWSAPRSISTAAQSWQFLPLVQ